MAHPSKTSPTLSPAISPGNDTAVDHPAYRTGIGLTQWLAWGLIAFSLFMVFLAVVINLITGSPGG